MWNTISIFVFFAQKQFSWLRKITVELMMLHGLFYRSPYYVSGHGNISVVLLSMEGLRALRFTQKHLNLCSDDERRTYGFGKTSGWVINNIIFIFGVNYPFNYYDDYITINKQGQLLVNSEPVFPNLTCYQFILVLENLPLFPLH